MERIFQIVAVILAGVAAYFLWAGNNDRAFVSAVLGSVAFFLSVRFQVKGRNRIRELEREKEQGQEEEISE
jgi:F0F1-type ATP synthase assembly protein I